MLCLFQLIGFLRCAVWLAVCDFDLGVVPEAFGSGTQYNTLAASWWPPTSNAHKVTVESTSTVLSMQRDTCILLGKRWR